MDLKTGTYRAAGSMWARSYRVIANYGDRVCIKIVNGPPNPYEGFERITVSSVSSSGGKLFVDAMGDVGGEILINKNDRLVNSFHFTIEGEGVRDPWQHDNDDFYPDDVIDECLSSTGKYEKAMQGKFIPGIDPNPNKGQLTAKTPDSQINVRTGPGTTFDSPHYGVVGDKVTLIESAREANSEQIWYKVKFTSSGVEGWVRSDFIQR